LLTPTQVADTEKLQKFLEFMILEHNAGTLAYPTLGDVYADSDYLYGHLVDGDDVIVWRVKTEGSEYTDLDLILLPSSELRERTFLNILEEAIGDNAWE